MIRVLDDLQIDEAELEIQATTSSGPGGQHVNRSNTRVVVRLDVAHSPSLSESQRARILSRLHSRISAAGVLQVSSQEHRSQARNRDTAIARLVELLARALHQDPPRRPTRPTPAARRARRRAKQRLSEKKQQRGKPKLDD